MIQPQHISMQKQRGAILLISLVLLTLITVISVTTLRSSSYAARNTVTLQQEILLHHLIKSELIAQVDRLREIDDGDAFNSNDITVDKPGNTDCRGLTEYIAFITCVVEAPGKTEYQVELQRFIDAGQLADSQLSGVTMEVWLAGNQLNEPNPNLSVTNNRNNDIYLLNRDTCDDVGNSNNGLERDCFGFAIVVEASFAGASYQQAAGFGLRPQN